MSMMGRIQKFNAEQNVLILRSIACLLSIKKNSMVKPNQLTYEAGKYLQRYNRVFFSTSSIVCNINKNGAACNFTMQLHNSFQRQLLLHFHIFSQSQHGVLTAYMTAFASYQIKSLMLLNHLTVGTLEAKASTVFYFMQSSKQKNTFNVGFVAGRVLLVECRLLFRTRFYFI